MQTSHPLDADLAPPVVCLDQGLIPLEGSQGETFALSLEILAGEFVMLNAEDDQHEEAVARVLCGLLPPLSGRVAFQGHDWRGLSPEWSCALRGRIGTVFGQDIWSPYRSLMDGVILPQLHHTRRPIDAICQEAAQWCLRFGLPGLPKEPPASASPEDRRSASFARAFLGNPALIVVRHQSSPLPPRLLQAVLSAIWEQRERGTAVVWFTRDDRATADQAVPAGRRHRIGGVGHAATEAPA